VKSVSAAKEDGQAPDRLTETSVEKLNSPSTSSDFDFHVGVNQVLAEVAMSAADSAGKLSFVHGHGSAIWFGNFDPHFPCPVTKRRSANRSE
jgi:hypothetical protein